MNSLFKIWYSTINDNEVVVVKYVNTLGETPTPTPPTKTNPPKRQEVPNTSDPISRTYFWIFGLSLVGIYLTLKTLKENVIE